MTIQELKEIAFWFITLELPVFIAMSLVFKKMDRWPIIPLAALIAAAFAILGWVLLTVIYAAIMLIEYSTYRIYQKRESLKARQING